MFTTSSTYLNIRHQLPQIGINAQKGQITKATVNESRAVGNGHEQAKSNKGWTQSSIDIDTYASRRVYGHRTMRDYTAERGQQGIAGVQQGVSRHAQETWSMIEQGPRKGNYPARHAHQQWFSKYHQRNRIDLQWLPQAQISFTPSQLTGEPNQGDVTERIETEPFANVQFTPGNLQTYLDNPGSINRFISQGHYDIYA